MRTNLGNTPLHLALENNLEYYVLLLLENGADPNEANNEGSTPLHNICQKNYSKDFVKLFFDVNDEIQQEMQVNAQDKLGNTPLHLALDWFNFKSINSARQNLNQSQRSKSASPPQFFFKLIPFHRDTVELLLKRGASPSLPNAKGLTPLHIVCSERIKLMDDYLVQILFTLCDDKYKPVQVDVQDKRGQTPLHLALANEKEDVTQFLLGRGVNPNVADAEGLTPLHIICQSVRNSSLLTSFFAIMDKQRRRVQVNAVDKLGRTPLQLAVANLLPDAVDVLLDRGADLSNFVFLTEGPSTSRPRPLDFSAHFKLNLASSAMIIVESLMKKGYQLNREDACVILNLFAQQNIEILHTPATLLYTCICVCICNRCVPRARGARDDHRSSSSSRERARADGARMRSPVADSQLRERRIAHKRNSEYSQATGRAATGSSSSSSSGMRFLPPWLDARRTYIYTKYTTSSAQGGKQSPLPVCVQARIYECHEQQRVSCDRQGSAEFLRDNARRTAVRGCSSGMNSIAETNRFILSESAAHQQQQHLLLIHKKLFPERGSNLLERETELLVRAVRAVSVSDEQRSEGSISSNGSSSSSSSSSESHPEEQQSPEPRASLASSGESDDGGLAPPPRKRLRSSLQQTTQAEQDQSSTTATSSTFVAPSDNNATSSTPNTSSSASSSSSATATVTTEPTTGAVTTITSTTTTQQAATTAPQTQSSSNDPAAAQEAAASTTSPPADQSQQPQDEAHQLVDPETATSSSAAAASSSIITATKEQMDNCRWVSHTFRSHDRTRVSSLV
ncbi:unnamed protein product [Trichogramma brassicae]|uniref:Uncharacterized protein n=1 Tax=Trichogramma brassicae TaxID=86971 RepID=A0A6H5IFB7_9HYME|nr:unnamed protein product [Trichogramma brassicae]